MRIGLDIDNVVSDYDKKILEEFFKEDKKNKGNRGIINPDGEWIREQFGWTREETETFFENNMQEFAKDFEPRALAKYYMDKLLADGHSLYLISHRAYPHYTEPYEITKDWLAKNGINYTKLILSKTTNKSNECREYNVDIMFDDVISNCHKLLDSNINCYLMGTRYNIHGREGLRVVNDWKELYEVVTNMEKKKVIIDTDMANEIDDHFALTYLMKSLDIFDLEAITIAPYSNSSYGGTKTIAAGIKKSYDLTLNILDLLGKSEYKSLVYKGATEYFSDNKEDNEAVEKIIDIANKNVKTTIIAIGAITNIALAITKCPAIIDKIKVVWLGGHSFLSKNNSEFNFRQDIKAVQTVFDSKVELVVIPCHNVASNLVMTTHELEYYLSEKTPLNKHLCQIFEECKRFYMEDSLDEIGHSKILWDMSAVAYEINADWFKSETISCPIVDDEGLYHETSNRHQVIFVHYLSRNKIFKDFFIKMGAKK